MVDKSDKNQQARGRPRKQAEPSSFAAFGAEFYRAVLPDRVKQACEGNATVVPVVNLHLAIGETLNLCHIAYLTDAWVAAYYYRDIETCEEMDLAFLPYPLVTMVTVSTHPKSTRNMGFDVKRSRSAMHGISGPASRANP